VELGEGDDLAEALRGAAGRCRVLGALGGDGTITTAAEVALAADRPLLAVPGGTLNHFCHALGLATAADAAAAVRDGGCVQVDVATIDGAPFLNTASFGAYPELVDRREELEGRIGKWPAMAGALAQVLRTATPLHVDLDGRPSRLWMVFIGNGRYEPPGFAPTWRSRLDEGVLDVRVVDATHPFARTRLVLAVLTGRLAHTAVYREWTTRRLDVRCPAGPLRLARDGETFEGGSSVAVEAGTHALKVFAPPR
jgi:diacylglycerol kinase family enzyme